MATPPCPVKNKTSVLLLKFGEDKNLIAWQSSPWENDTSAKVTQPLRTGEWRGKATAESCLCSPPPGPRKKWGCPFAEAHGCFLLQSHWGLPAPGLRALTDVFPAVIYGEEGGRGQGSMQTGVPLLLLDTLYFLRRNIFLQRCCLHLGSSRDRPVLRQRFKGQLFIWEVAGGEKGIQYWEEKTPIRACYSSSHRCGRLGLHSAGKLRGGINSCLWVVLSEQGGSAGPLTPRGLWSRAVPKGISF